MEAVIPRLYASMPEALGFGPGLEIRAFLLEREQGNLLVYRSAELEQEQARVNELGGVARQYLNHWHEASPACDRVAEAFGAPLHAHEGDAPRVAERCTVGATFSERHRLDDDFEVIPTPGHTPGATAFLWDTGRHRCLFTGDTIMLSEQGWRAAVLDSSDRERYLESLELIRGLDFDVLVPSVAGAGLGTHAVVERAEAERQIDAILGRVRSGQSG